MPLKEPVLRTKLSEARSRRVTTALILADAAVGGLLAAMVAFALHASHLSYQARASDTVTGLVAIAQANIASELARVDALMQATLDELLAQRRQGPLVAEAANQALELHRRPLPDIEGFYLADEQGRLRWGNGLPTGRIIDIADRDFFVRLRDRPDLGASVAAPLRSPVSGNWVLMLVRPVRSSGRFDGVLLATITIDHFQRLFAGYNLGEQDALTLRTSQLELVARHAPGTPTPLQVGSATVSTEFRDAFTRDATRGTFVSRTRLDGIERTNAYRRVDGQPLLVVAGLANDRFFAPWKDAAWQIALLALTAWLLIVGATVAIHRALARDARTMRALATQTRRTQTLLRVAADGIHILDRHGYLLGMSDSFAELLGSTPEKLLGRHVSSWDASSDKARLDRWFSRIKDGDRTRAELQHRREDGSTVDVELQLSVAEIDDELLVFASTRDMTERKRLQASLAASSAQIRDLYDRAPCGYHSLDGQGMFVHANATILSWLGLPEKDVVGKAHLVDFLDEAGRASFALNFPRLKAEGSVEGLVLRLVPANAPPRQLRASVTAVYGPDGAYLMSRSVTLDITAQYEAEQEAARLMREQTAMLDNDIVGMVKLRGRVALWNNRAMARLFGYEPAELEGQSARLLYPDDESFQALGAHAYPILASGQNYRTQIQLRHKDGHLVWIDLSGVQLSDDLTFWTMVDISAMKEAQASIEHIAFHDALTQLPNRLLLQDRLRQAILGAQRAGNFVAVCYLDLDGFKTINDAHGHDAGDTLLLEIGGRLQAAVRANDTAARVGGDEFVLVLTMLDGDIEWLDILDRAVAAIRLPVTLPSGTVVSVDTSVGVALAPQHGWEPSTLVRMADEAMLRAKRAGKHRVEVAEP